MCWINLVAKVAYAMGPELSRALISLGISTFNFFNFFYIFCLSIFPPGADAGFTKPGGGGAPMQALAPGRWRPSLRHCIEEGV